MGYAFISYSTKNQAAADAMRELFSKNNIDTWMAPYDIPAGSEYAEVLHDALECCSCLVLMLTEDSQNSAWVKKEVNIAITNGKTIIPVKMEDIELNSSMKLYLNDQQIVPVHVIEDKSVEIQNIINRVVELTGETTNVSVRCEEAQHIKPVPNVAPKKTPYHSKQKNSVKYRHYIRLLVVWLMVLFALMLPMIVIFVFKQSFGLLWRIFYFSLLLLVAKMMIYLINSNPTIASLCFGTLTEEDLKESPDVIFSRVVGVFGKNAFVSKEKTKHLKCLYKFKRMTFGTWDDKKINYLKITFRRTLERYDPSVFYLHSSSKEDEALKLLTRQGFILQSLPTFINEKGNYFIKNDFHVFLYFKKKRLDYVVIYQCAANELLDKMQEMEERINEEYI